MAITLKDVAQKAGVAPSTVSLVLNAGKSNVPISEKTRARVSQAAKELGYRPNPAARGLRLNRTHTVGVVSYDINDPMAIVITSKLDLLLADSGYRTVVGDAMHNDKRAGRHIKEFAATKVDGMVLLSSSWAIDKKALTEAVGTNFPIVSIGKDLSDKGIQSFRVDNWLGARMAVEHLLSLGRQSIGIIAGTEMYAPDSELRLAGAKEALELAGVDLPAGRFVREVEGGWNPNAGYRSMKRLMDSADKLDAVFAFDDCAAFGAIRAIYEAGRSVPDDIAVIGFDDLMVSEFYNPPLTTIRQPVTEMTQKAAEYLLSRIEGGSKDNPQLEVFVPELVVRSSCGASISS